MSIKGKVISAGAIARPIDLSASPSAPRNAQDASAQSYDPALLGTNETDRAATPLVKKSPETYDIGGMKLYMSPSEVMRVAKAKGMKLVYKPSTTNASFANSVDYEMRVLKGGYAGDKRYGDISFMRLIDADKSTWSIHFTPSEKGQVVYLIEYDTPWAGRTPNDLAAALYAKYGPPTEGIRPQTSQYFNLSWCSGVRNCYFPNSATAPAIMYANGRESALTLKLDIGVGARLRFEKAIKDAAQARLAKTAPKASF